MGCPALGWRLPRPGRGGRWVFFDSLPTESCKMQMAFAVVAPQSRPAWLTPRKETSTPRPRRVAALYLLGGLSFAVSVAGKTTRGDTRGMSQHVVCADRAVCIRSGLSETLWQAAKYLGLSAHQKNPSISRTVPCAGKLLLAPALSTLAAWILPGHGPACLMGVPRSWAPMNPAKRCSDI